MMILYRSNPKASLAKVFFGPTIAMALMCCAPGARARFTENRNFDPCIQSLFACPPADYATCTLDDRNFAEVQMPEGSPFRFIVDVPTENSVIFTRLFFDNQRFRGENTQVVWNTPGCKKVEIYESGGTDLFEEAAGIGYFQLEYDAQETGAHLLEISSDMQAEVLVSVIIEEKP